jgi:hypothetical protein
VSRAGRFYLAEHARVVGHKVRFSGLQGVGVGESPRGNLSLGEDGILRAALG